MSKTRLESVVTPRLTPDERLRDTRGTTLYQILDIGDAVVEQTDQTEILTMMEQAADDAADASVMNSGAFCKVGFDLSSTDTTSQFPSIRTDDEFVRSRNDNFAAMLSR